jgi:RND superfamily putative drug exporter
MNVTADGATNFARPGVFGWLSDFVVRWPVAVIGIWIALASSLSVALPPLSEIAARQQTSVLPNDAPVLATAQQMSQAFHETGTDNTVFAVLTNEKGLSRADEHTYSTLVDKLRHDPRDVKTVQDFLSTPPLREVLQSEDNKAWNLPITFASGLDPPQARLAYRHVADIVKQTVAGSTLTANLAGPAATDADLNDASERDLHLIEVGTAIMVLALLLVVYRNLVTMLLPLITIGISVVTARGVLAGFSELGLRVSNETIVLMSGVMIGAGTDYAIFLISRYHDYVRLGADSNRAVKEALTSIGKVIAASAATVAVTFLAMISSRLPVFATVGPAISISIVVAFIAALTLLPAILVLSGPHGWISPRQRITNRFWRRSGVRIVRRPKTYLSASLLALVILASCAGFVQYNYDDRKTLPHSVESAVGYAALNRHFPDSLIPQYLFIESPHDLRTPQALADLEQMAQRVNQVPGIAKVRGITRPRGEPLEEAKSTYQAGEVGKQLTDASKQISNQGGDLDMLTRGADELAENLSSVRGQVTRAMGAIGALVDALASWEHHFGGDKTLKDVDKTAKLVRSMRALGDTLGVNFANVADSFDWAGPVLTALDASPVCTADPTCSNSRIQLQRLVTARSDGTLDKIADLGRQLQSTHDAQTVGSTVQSLGGALGPATQALASLGLDQPGGLLDRLATLQKGADAFADGSRRLAEGVQVLVDEAKKMGAGLGEASAFLLAMKYDAAKPSMAGFYLPPQLLTREEFQKAATSFISPDGHAARYFVQTKLNPFSTAAMDQVNSITDAARAAQANTALADAKISMTGFSAGLRDTRDYYNHDIRFFVVTTIIIVLLILIVLLRAIVAALYLICSVVISYSSALGIGVIVFQFLLGQELHWSLPGLTFILLVAVGADYNLLLISRIHDESPYGVRLGVIRTVGSTGGVITLAGLIFATSMFGLLFASISSLSQAGFVIGVGILLDTFLVRTVTVPAIAVIVGRANWWPYQWWPRPRAPIRPAKRVSRPGRLISDSSTRAERTPAIARVERRMSSRGEQTRAIGRGDRTRLPLPPTVIDRHLQRRRQSDAHRLKHHLATKAMKAGVDGHISVEADGELSLEQRHAATDRTHPAYAHRHVKWLFIMKQPGEPGKPPPHRATTKAASQGVKSASA